MDHVSPFCDAPPRRIALLFVMAMGLGLLIGCDRTRDAESSSAAGSEQQTNEVVIESESFTEADLKFEPASISPENTFSIVLPGEGVGQRKPRISHEKVEDGRHDLKALFNPLDPSSVSVECRNENTGNTRKIAELRPNQLGSKANPKRFASTRDWPSSFHYYTSPDLTFWSVDYGGKNPGTMVDFPNADQPMECTHVSFKLEDVDSSFTASGILFEGIEKAPRFRYRQFE